MSVTRSVRSDDHGRPPAGAAELDRFLLENPSVQYVDCVFADLCGAIRGKRVTRDDLERIFKSGLEIPASIYFLDARGDPVELKDQVLTEGTAWPVPATLSRVNWSQRPHGQLLMTLVDAQGAPHLGEPRNVLRRVVERFAELELVPVVATQLEFFLLDHERTKAGLTQAPKAAVAAAAEQEDLATEIGEAADMQSLPPIAMSEASPQGQCEIDIEAVPDAVRAADHAVFLRQLVRAVARKTGRDASFMAKPFLDLPGSGMHVRARLRHRAGKNVFDEGGELMRFAIGGLQAVMAESIALFAPSVNSHRRYTTAPSVPRNKRWGLEGSKAGLRASAPSAKGRSIEHRIAGADANPYLVMAAILAGIHHGISHEIDPGPPFEGDALSFVDQTLPFNVDAALLTLENGSIMREYLGPAYVDLYCATKRAELDRFRNCIPAHEYDWYV